MKKGIYGITRRPTDALWTKYRRITQEYTCQKCGREYSPDNKAALQNLGVSHYHGRSHENVRFDEDNTNLMCNFPCHDYYDHHKTEYKEWMIKRLGQEGFDMLQLRAETYKARDDVSDKIIIKQIIKELEGK